MHQENNNIKLIVSSTKQTTYMDKPAWTVPNGQCTENFLFACRCWEYFLDGDRDWLCHATFNRGEIK